MPAWMCSKHQLRVSLRLWQGVGHWELAQHRLRPEPGSVWMSLRSLQLVESLEPEQTPQGPGSRRTSPQRDSECPSSCLLPLRHSHVSYSELIAAFATIYIRLVQVQSHLLL